MDSSSQMIQKGKITSIVSPEDRNGDLSRARVVPCTGDGVETRPITIPWWLRGRMGLLAPETEVAYTLFEDMTGVILSRMDGEWPGFVPGDVEFSGIVTAEDFITGVVPSYNVHIHGGVMSGGGTTSTPQ